jgi:hypothetical protein
MINDGILSVITAYAMRLIDGKQRNREIAKLIYGLGLNNILPLHFTTNSLSLITLPSDILKVPTGGLWFRQIYVPFKLLMCYGILILVNVFKLARHKSTAKKS